MVWFVSPTSVAINPNKPAADQIEWIDQRASGAVKLFRVNSQAANRRKRLQQIHVGDEGLAAWWKGESLKSSWYAYEVMFHKKQDAVLFKLIWGGQ